MKKHQEVWSRGSNKLLGSNG